ncbi:MAG: folate-binding protein YgfZ [Proteobacteria bacterium]|nr:folate-binding protein YgfZ [Pseudomonadota bacterium]
MNQPLAIDGAIGGVVRLDHLGVLRASGADAATFLQSQLTNDVVSLEGGAARLAGYCSAKGRLQASFIVWRPSPDEFLLACAADLLPATLKRLSMFVLRARCRLSDASAEIPLSGLVGPSVPAGADWSRFDADGATTIVLPKAAGTRRALVAGHPPQGAAMAAETWRWLDVQSGVPLIVAATVDRFVPQMANFELLRGVDFKKGCYPGQEIVARSQYRGTIKRRMFLFDVDAAAQPGDEVFHDADPGQPAGMVVNGAPRPDGRGSSALVEVKLAALERGSLHLGSTEGAPLRRAPLPYAVPVEGAETSGTPSVA